MKLVFVLPVPSTDIFIPSCPTLLYVLVPYVPVEEYVLFAEFTAATTLARLALLILAKGFLLSSANPFSLVSFPGLLSLCL